ncbi:GspE/PulE family protein [Pseudomonas japonica]|uniref:GspE/PulE family protein n=1 Tax=Pseudomonas japonica TaxID=256466 RepID=UPI0015E3AB47|nr:ATPase, T2SS/T4P/T4SS family [Pseudomonas japonica]MBA1289927.1 Flp pilus assembly complex ATPase component TadA [Pseudomonas japonica]
MTEPSLPPMPFRYASRAGVLLEGTAAAPVLVCRGQPGWEVCAEVRRWLGHEPCLQQLDDTAFAQRLARHYQGDEHDARHVAERLNDDQDLNQLAVELPHNLDLLEDEAEAPVIRLINALLAQAVRERASDVHLDTEENAVVVRLRVDGHLREVLRARREASSSLVSRLKVMAGLDIAEKRVPQDGRIALRLAGHDIDIRLSTLPCVQGERVVLRLLDRSAVPVSLEHIMPPGPGLERLQGVLARPHGIFLVTGPTGSGKTTSLYAALASLREQARNILTVEDPVEYHLPGIGQSPVNAAAGMTFARGLRAILRQDPDVVMVGEIRDRETAEVAIQASLTGHLVLSTLHTNSAVGAVTRLLDMGVDAYLLASSLTAVQSQRLVRLLCVHCKQPHASGGFEPVGCEHCRHGYRGRMALHELVEMDSSLMLAIHDGASEQQLESLARQQAPGLAAAGLQAVADGLTSLTEVRRVVEIGP